MIKTEIMRKKVEEDAKKNGCYLNPDNEFLAKLLEGLIKNENRYGYPSCPCRLASGKIEYDNDIVCPCDYMDQDIEEYGCCYCCLFVNKEILQRKKQIKPIPERRLLRKQMRVDSQEKESYKPSIADSKILSEITLKLYYCKQCGYLCFREEPPYRCPICKAKKEMFQEIKIQNLQ
jgi:ferredoxin-thioredoxin reductase catalytic subunit